jgi:hypothetical protein
MRIFLLVLTSVFALYLRAQESVMANDRQAHIAYWGIENLLDVFVEQCGCKAIQIVADNGKIQKRGCNYIYRAASTGEVNFTIYKKEKGKLVYVRKYTWLVLPIPKPIASIGGLPSGSTMAKKAFAAQGGVGALIPHEKTGLCVQCPVDSFTFMIMRDSVIQFSLRIYGNQFDRRTANAMEQMMPGDIVVIINIWARDALNQAVRIDPLEYVIN